MLIGGKLFFMSEKTGKAVMETAIFFDTVEANYTVETILPLEPFLGGSTYQK
jgi:hypothetical protein